MSLAFVKDGMGKKHYGKGDHKDIVQQNNIKVVRGQGVVRSDGRHEQKGMYGYQHNVRQVLPNQKAKDGWDKNCDKLRVMAGKPAKN